MGLLSSIKKGLKKIGRAVKKVFKGAVKVVRKALANKWVRGLLMATTFFTGFGAVIGAFSAGGFGAGMAALGNHIVAAGINVIKAPFDLVAGGLKAAGSLASGAGAESLGTFASNLGKGLSSKVDSVANATSNILKIGGDAAGATNAIAGGGLNSQSPAATVDPVTGAKTFATNDAAQGAGSLGQTGASSPVTPPASGGGTTFADVTAPKNAPMPNSPVVPGTGEALAAPVAKSDGILKRAIGWAERNPELTKVGLDAVAGMTAPEEYTQGQFLKDRDHLWRGYENQGSQGVFSSEKGQSILQQIRQRNQELFNGQTPQPTGQ